jgi:hypothetical protein
LLYVTQRRRRRRRRRKWVQKGARVEDVFGVNKPVVSHDPFRRGGL